MWSRRIIAVPLLIIFFCIFVVSFLLVRPLQLATDPGFLKRQLTESDIYHYVADDLPRIVVNEAIKNEQLERALSTLGISHDDIVSVFSKSLPEEWLQSQTEDAIDEFGGYFFGNATNLDINIQIADRFAVASEELNLLVQQANIYDFLLDEVLSAKVSDIALQNFNIQIDESEIALSIRRAIPENWLKRQVGDALTEGTPYMIGQKDSLELRVDPSELQETAINEVRLLISNASLGTVFRDVVLDPYLDDNVPQSINLLFGVSISSEEIKTTIKDALTPALLEMLLADVINELGSYIWGKTDQFAVTISLDPIVVAATKSLEQVATAKLAAMVEALPACRLDQLVTVGKTLPMCKVSGFDWESWIENSTEELLKKSDNFIGGIASKPIVLTDAHLNQLFGEENSAFSENLNVIRTTLRDGWVYTDIDLKQNLLSSQGESAVQQFENLREMIQSGLVYTDTEVRLDLATALGESGLKEFDDSINNLRNIKSNLSLVFIAVLVLLLFINSLLLTRSWIGRIKCMALLLVLASATVLVIARVLASFVSVASDAIVDVVRPLMTESTFGILQSQVLIASVENMVHNLVAILGSNLMSEITRPVFGLLVVAILAFLGVWIIHRIRVKSR